MKFEFLDMLRDVRFGCGLRNKMKFATAVLIHIVGTHSSSRWVSDRIVKSVLMNTLVSIKGCKFYLLDADSLDVISPRFEHFLDYWFQVNEGDVFIDVGAHIGKYTVHFARKGSRVMAIEPDTVTFRSLARNIRVNNLKNVILLNVAAWNERTELVLYSGPYAGQNSVKLRSNKWVVVHSETLDSLARQYRLTKVNWIKVDVEQAEVEVLEGAQQTILESKPKIIVEVWGQNESKMKAFVSKIGYGAVHIGSLSHPSSAFYWLLVPLTPTSN
jgi:FkbM family methyltransferase